MHHFFEKFGKFTLFAVTILLVLAFQSYWLWNNFQKHKREILDQTSLKMQEVLINEAVFTKTSDKNQSLDDNMKAEITKKVSEIINLNNIKNFDGKISIESTDQKIAYSNKNSGLTPELESMLYSAIQPYMDKNYGKPNFTVYLENKTTKKTFPAGRILKNENTTSVVNSILHPENRYRIHIENLPYIVFSRMYDEVLFSIIYLLLFLGTVILLFNNVNINKRLLKNKEIFTRNVTHELKIPITTIMIAAEGFEKYNIIEEPEAAKKYIKTIQRAGNQLSLFVESILQHAKVENGYTKTSENSINLLVLLKDVKSVLSEIITEKKANIFFLNIPETIFIKGDEEQMKQIFLNLFENSIKYSVREPEILVKYQAIGHRILVTIQDNGIGIPKKYMEDIFQPYFRATDGDLHDVKGFGLGLSFVRSALKNQNGKIHVKESSSNGTTMELNLAAYE